MGWEGQMDSLTRAFKFVSFSHLCVRSKWLDVGVRWSMGLREEQAKGAVMPPARWTRNILVSFTVGTPALVLLRGAALTCIAS